MAYRINNDKNLWKDGVIPFEISYDNNIAPTEVQRQ